MRDDAPPEEAGVDPQTLEALLEGAAATTAVDPLCAAQVAVARHGKLVAFRAFGRARFAGVEKAATRDSLFTTYSVTKAITSAAAWILLHEGKLGLEQRVADHVPEFAANGKEVVTIEQLLTHTSGFPLAAFDNTDWEDPARRRERFASWQLDWAPGSRFVYHATSSMWALAEVITRRAGVDYREFARERIFQPLGLGALSIGLPIALHARVPERIVVGQPTSHDSAVDAPAVDESMLVEGNDPAARAAGSPAGGAIGTAADVALFYQGLLADAAGKGPGIWDPATLADAWTPRNVDFIDPMTGRAALRGLGVVVAGDREPIWRGFAAACSAQTIGHMGLGGQIAWADPVSGISFVYLTNGAHRSPVSQHVSGLKLSGLAAACAR